MLEAQKVNVYNRHLPYGKEVDDSADRFFSHIITVLKQSLRGDLQNGKLDCQEIYNGLDGLQKYVVLYGLRFSKSEHVKLIQWLLALLQVENVELYCLEKVCRLATSLIKKKYLLGRRDLVIEWRPLYDLAYKWDSSSLAVRGMIKVPVELRAQLTRLIKTSRAYFHEEATQEMLDEFRPLFCFYDRSIMTALKYLSLFLPTSSSVPPEKCYKLWLSDTVNLWKTFSNWPSWEVDVFNLWSRLALNMIGRIDWSDTVEAFFTRFMAAFSLPVTYAGSNIRIDYGTSFNLSCLTAAARWITSAVSGGGSAGDDPVLRQLGKMLLAIESYFHPANFSSVSEQLHMFISDLCTFFVRRVHNERHNAKWETKIPIENRLTEEDVEHFVKPLLPIAFHVLYNNLDDDRRIIFNLLSTLKPDLVLPPLVRKLNFDVQLMNTPNRFTACVAALSGCSRSLVENYPLEVVNLLSHLLPGINVNDIYKSTDIFLLISDFLDMIWLVDFSSPSTRSGSELTSAEMEVCLKSSIFEDFVLSFIDRCLTLVENSSREQTRQENNTMEETMNEEEFTVDCSISETFQKIVFRCSAPIFNLALDKLKPYVTSRILEPAVAGSIVASMCKACVCVRPELSLQFFVPHLCQRVETILGERVHENKSDHELQYVLKVLSEIFSIRGYLYTAKTDLHPILPHVQSVCDRVLDKTLCLPQKDEYELAGAMLNNMLHSLVHTHPVKVFPAQQADVQWSREEFHWAKEVKLDDLTVDWYVPSEVERSASKQLIEKYLKEPLDLLSRFSRGESEMAKEEVIRNVTLVNKIMCGASELLPPMFEGGDCMLPRRVQMLEPFCISMGGQNIRRLVNEVFHDVQKRILAVSPDNTEALNCLICGYEVLIFFFGIDDEDLHDNIEDQRAVKSQLENKMVRSKLHLEVVHYHRVLLQHGYHLFLSNQVSAATLPVQVLEDLFELSVSRYSEVRSVAQLKLQKLMLKTSPRSQEILVSKLVECFKDSPDVSEQQMKGALFIISEDSLGFFSNWKFASALVPALVRAQHCEKPSVIDALKDLTLQFIRVLPESNIWFDVPVRQAKVTERLRGLLGPVVGQGVSDGGGNANEVNEDYLGLEKTLCELLTSGSLHWRHHLMAIGILHTMTVPGYVPSESVLNIWMDCLVHDDRTTRFLAMHSIECILKAAKPKRRSQQVDVPQDVNEDIKCPGVREDNLWLQYREGMTDENMEAYWKEPFVVKLHAGFYSWPKGKMKMRVVDNAKVPKFVENALVRFFSSEANMREFLRLFTQEFKKGEDIFSLDKGHFFSGMFEVLGQQLMPKFLPHLRKFAASDQETEQRAASEIIYGILRGTRFCSFAEWKLLVSELAPVVKTALANITAETIGDWESMINAATTKADPNRLRWLMELLFDEVKAMDQSPFREACNLRLLYMCVFQNWRCRSLHTKIFNFLKGHCDHPYQKVRRQIGQQLSAALAFDLAMFEPSLPPEKRWNCGRGFPTTKELVDHVLPHLSLNHHNPELKGVVTQNGESQAHLDHSNGAGGSSRICPAVFQSPPSLAVEDFFVSAINGDECPTTEAPSVSPLVGKSNCQAAAALSLGTVSKLVSKSNFGPAILKKVIIGDRDVTKSSLADETPSNTPESFGGSSGTSSSSTNTLETVAIWLSHSIQHSSASMSADVYQLLPFFCQFIGTETGEVSQACLKALCYLSVCNVTPEVIPTVLDMSWKVMQSTSWKAKLSILEFVQVFVFSNFMSLCLHDDLVRRAEEITVHLLSDENANVQQKAAKVLGGMIHSHFLNEEYQKGLLRKFRTKIYSVRKPKKRAADGGWQPPAKRRKPAGTVASASTSLTVVEVRYSELKNDKKAMADFHSGILGLCAIVEAYPYDIPVFLPDVLIELEKHVHDPEPVPKTIKKTFQEFKRTHQDNWTEHKLKFTEDQLAVLTDLLVSPNYYA